MLTEEAKEQIQDKSKVVRYYYYSLLDELVNMPLEDYREIKDFIISVYGENGFKAIAKKAVAEYRKDE